MKKSLLLMLLSTVSWGAIAQTCISDISKSAPNSRFITNENGTVEDLKTGLIWMRCPLGKVWNSANNECTGKTASFSWQPALNEAHLINSSKLHRLHKFGGYENWRLPSIKELISLVEKACHTPTLNTKAFPNFIDLGEWSIPETTATLWSSTATGSGDSVLVFNSVFGETLIQSPNMAGGDYGALLVTDSK